MAPVFKAQIQDPLEIKACVYNLIGSVVTALYEHNIHRNTP